MELNSDTKSNKDHEIADLFKDFFSSVYTLAQNTNTDINNFYLSILDMIINLTRNINKPKYYYYMNIFYVMIIDRDENVNQNVAYANTLIAASWIIQR